MKLHENSDLFNQASIATSQRLGLQQIFIEKDYWVTYALFLIFSSSLRNEVVFKGGTALAKCFQMIERFSEDIDLVVLRKEGESNNQLANKLKSISKQVSKVLPEIDIIGITNKKGMIRKTAHSYKKQFQGNFGHIQDHIVIESSWLGNFDPFTDEIVSSYIYEMMLETEQTRLIDEYSLNPFKVQVLSIKRTLCEKIMSLVRFSYTDNPIKDIQSKIRHLYDIHKILENSEYLEFFVSEEFEKMMLVVANDDIMSFKNNNDWLKYHPVEAMIFSNPEETWNKIKNIYNTDFKDLIYGTFPNEGLILETLIKVSKRLKLISWNIDPKSNFL